MTRAMRQPPIAVTAFVAALALAACSRGGSRTGVPPVDACNLLTREDAAAVLGATPPAAATEKLGDASFVVTQCRYQAGTGKTLGVIISRVSKADSAVARTNFDIMRKGAAKDFGIEPVDVSGVGDAAYWISHRLSSDLHVVAGDTLFMFILQGPELAEPPAALREAAAAAVRRLP